MSAGQCSAQAGAGQLQQLQADGVQLDTRSLQLLSLQDPREQQAYAATKRDAGSSELSFITCMAVIRQAADEVRCSAAQSKCTKRKAQDASAARSYSFKAAAAVRVSLCSLPPHAQHQQQ
jgi:hypothetical protein